MFLISRSFCLHASFPSAGCKMWRIDSMLDLSLLLSSHPLPDFTSLWCSVHSSSCSVTTEIIKVGKRAEIMNMIHLQSHLVFPPLIRPNPESSISCSCGCRNCSEYDCCNNLAPKLDIYCLKFWITGAAGNVGQFPQEEETPTKKKNTKRHRKCKVHHWPLIL